MHYFDWTATTPVSESALNEYSKISREYPGNPSSTHPMGLKAKERLEEERKHIASLLGVPSSTVYFTSGGTESDSIVLSSLLNTLTPGTILTSAIEHSAVLEYKGILQKYGWTFKSLRCPGGYLNPLSVKEALTPDVRMLCVMSVNNVTGTVQDLNEIVSVVREYSKSTGRSIHIHCDCVQSMGKIPFDPVSLDIDSCAVSSHKFFGPRGVGILYNRNKGLLSLSRGGGQEKGLRGGTENLPAICAMGVALEEALASMNENYETVSNYRNMVEKAALESGYSVLSPISDSGKCYSPYIINICVKPLPSEVFLRIMGDKGFCLSAGSACSTNSRGKAESVLEAMQIKSQDRMSSIRVSICAKNTEEEVSLLCEAIRQTAKDYK
ncbi:MAG: cysteine desulfurase [Sphaerochaetaceae bacterium]|nr:cysteine desulfurase [Sphaerochaetaceae bacterium]